MESLSSNPLRMQTRWADLLKDKPAGDGAKSNKTLLIPTNEVDSSSKYGFRKKKMQIVVKRV